MARAKARYGSLVRSVAAAMAGKSSVTITAEAFVVLAAEAYFTLETKVICPGWASSIPATPVMSQSVPSRRQLRCWARSESFTGTIVDFRFTNYELRFGSER